MLSQILLTLGVCLVLFQVSQAGVTHRQDEEDHQELFRESLCENFGCDHCGSDKFQQWCASMCDSCPENNGDGENNDNKNGDRSNTRHGADDSDKESTNNGRHGNNGKGHGNNGKGHGKGKGKDHENNGRHNGKDDKDDEKDAKKDKDHRKKDHKEKDDDEDDKDKSKDKSKNKSKDKDSKDKDSKDKSKDNSKDKSKDKDSNDKSKDKSKDKDMDPEKHFQENCKDKGLKKCVDAKVCSYKIKDVGDLMNAGKKGCDLQTKFSDYIQSASDGNDNSKCCKDKFKGDKAVCVEFCTAKGPKKIDPGKHFPCMNVFDDIMKCHEKGL